MSEIRVVVTTDANVISGEDPEPPCVVCGQRALWRIESQTIIFVMDDESHRIEPIAFDYCRRDVPEEHRYRGLNIQGLWERVQDLTAELAAGVAAYRQLDE